MALDAIREKVVAGPFSDMNYNLLHASEKGAVEKALETIEQLPMMAKMRLVVLKEAEAVKGQWVDRLADYLSKPNTFTCLVLCYSKLNKTTKIWKRSKKKGVALQFERIYERQMPFWIKRMAVRYEKKISSQAVSFLVRSIGPDLAKADAELEKASLYAGEEKDVIDVEDLEAVLAAVKAERIFDLTDALGKKQSTAALYLTKKMIDGGEQPLRILWQVGSHMTKLMLVRSMLSAGAPPGEIGRAMGVMDFVRDKLVDQAKVFPRKHLRHSLVLIAKTDLELKSGRINSQAILEKLILDLCG
jgi:DNA polymerase-3 subunit delta